MDSSSHIRICFELRYRGEVKVQGWGEGEATESLVARQNTKAVCDAAAAALQKMWACHV